MYFTYDEAVITAGYIPKNIDTVFINNKYLNVSKAEVQPTRHNINVNGVKQPGYNVVVVLEDGTRTDPSRCNGIAAIYKAKHHEVA